MHSISYASSNVTKRRVFCLGAFLALIALLPAILPYGGRFVTRGDFIEQQLPFILETKRILQCGLNAYSFNTFLGSPAVGSYAFYTLGSPFVWPLALLPESLIPYGISIMAVLKHAVCALTSYCFLRRVLHSDGLALLGSLLYTFSSFTIVNTQFYHFTEVIAFFPLILLGLEIAMSDSPRPGLLSLFCFINTLTNYYFMLSGALLSALYFAFRLFSADWKPYRSFRRVVCVVFECGLGCAMAGVLLLPAMHFMLSITRTGSMDTSLLTHAYTPSQLLERLRVLFMPIESTVVHAFYGDADSWSSTAAYLPVFGMTGVLVFFAAHRSARWLKALLLALLFISAVPVLCGLFVLETNLSYTRWWYGLVLMLTLATLYALRDRPPAKHLRSWLFAFLASSLFVAVCTVPFALPETLLRSLEGTFLQPVASFILNRRIYSYASPVFRALSFSLALLGGGVMLCLLIRRLAPRLRFFLLCLCLCTQYAGYIAVCDRFIPADCGFSLSEIAQPTLNTLSMSDSDSYTRIDYAPALRNYGLLRGSSSLTCFTSLRSGYLGRFVSMAGFGYDESVTVTPANSDPALRAFLSVGEYHQMLGESVPEGFVYDRQENGFAVYTNPNRVPMGFLQTVITGTHHQRMDPDTVGTVLLAAAALDDADLAEFDARLPRLDVHAIPDWQQSVQRLQQNACDSFTTHGNGFSAHINAKEAGLLVFTIPYDKGFSASVDGVPTRIVPCDVSFMSVWVEPGEHTIEFTFRTRSLVPGIALSIVSALTLLLYVLLCRRRRTSLVR